MEAQMPEWVQQYLPFLQNVLLAIVIFIVGWIASKWAAAIVRQVCRKRNIDEAAAGFLATILRYSVIIAAVIACLGTVGIQTTSLVAIFASAGLAVGLALQGNLSNFASGVMILIFRPLELGHRIKVDGFVGTVADISLFTTTLTSFGNEKVIVPNSSITGGIIVNYTAPGTLRGSVEVGIGYGSDVEKAMSVMLEAAKRSEAVLADPPPQVAFTNLGASSLDFAIHAWCDCAKFRVMCNSIRTSVYEDLDKAGIEIPFSQLVIHKAED